MCVGVVKHTTNNTRLSPKLFSDFGCNRMYCGFINYRAMGRCGGFGVGSPLSPEKTFKGKWNEFKAPVSMTVDSFSGPARLDGTIGLTILTPNISTDRDFHFDGFADTRWWSAPVFNFTIKEIDTGTSTELTASIGFFEPDPVGSFKYRKGSMVAGYTRD